MDFDGGGIGIGVECGEDCEAVEWGEWWKPANGVDVFVFGETVDYWAFRHRRHCHCQGFRGVFCNDCNFADSILQDKKKVGSCFFVTEMPLDISLNYL